MAGGRILADQLNNGLVDKIDTYVVLTTDLGFGNVLAMNSADDKEFTLPVLSAADLGKPITFVKKGAGKTTIQAGASQKVGDSSADGTLYDDIAAEIYASVTLMPVTTTQWDILGFDGTWSVT